MKCFHCKYLIFSLTPFNRGQTGWVQANINVFLRGSFLLQSWLPRYTALDTEHLIIIFWERGPTKPITQVSAYSYSNKTLMISVQYN